MSDPNVLGTVIALVSKLPPSQLAKLTNLLQLLNSVPDLVGTLEWMLRIVVKAKNPFDPNVWSRATASALSRTARNKVLDQAKKKR